MSDRKYNIVYLYKKTNTDILRYSLRGLKNVPVGEVFIVGDKPPWATNIIHIPYAFGKSKIQNEWGQLFEACRHTDDFLLFNDDFIILEPIERYMFFKRDIRRPSSVYYNAFLRTKKLFSGFKNYEVHVPMYFVSKKFLKLKNEYDIRRGYLHRSLYGNHYKCGGVRVKDNKIYQPHKIEGAFKKAFLSTTNKIERNEQFKTLLHGVFPEKSIYEADDIHQS